MPHFSQEQKAEMAPKIAAIAKKYGITAKLAVKNNNTVVLNIWSGKIDFLGNYMEVTKEIASHTGRKWEGPWSSIEVESHDYYDLFNGEALDFLLKVFAVLSKGNQDTALSRAAGEDILWFVNVNIGKWGKPYQLIK